MCVHVRVSPSMLEGCHTGSLAALRRSLGEASFTLACRLRIATLFEKSSASTNLDSVTTSNRRKRGRKCLSQACVWFCHQYATALQDVTS